MTTNKYKVSVLAKDLEAKNKDITGILVDAGYSDLSKATSIDAVQFEVLIEKLSSLRQIESIDKYMNGELYIKSSAKADLKEPVTESASESASVPVREIKEDKKEQVQKASEIKSEEKHESKSEVKPENKQKNRQEAKKEDKPENKNEADVSKKENIQKSAIKINNVTGKQNASEKRVWTKPTERVETGNKQKNSKNAKPLQKPAMQQNNSGNIKGEVKIGVESNSIKESKNRIVDTRTTIVDLSKYDEKLEKFVSEDGNGKRSNQNSGGKQKFVKKNSAKYDKPSDREKMAMEKIKKQEAEKAKKQPLNVLIPDEIVVSELAQRLKVTAAEVIKRLFMLGVVANINQVIDYDTAYLVADELGAKVTKEVILTIEDKLFDETDDSAENLEERAPVVVVMGHVDHGKTSILDAIRHTNVTAGEAGGITQHIGAYRVNINGKPITFLDTPGHEAFTAMRARGAMATDIAILVVAADDGIMPQTVEAINHAKAAGLDIIVAINKMDKPGANPDAVKQELTKYELVPEEWGGDVICVPVSALTKQGIDELLENVLLVAEMKELKANPHRRAKGIVIEAKLDKGRGPVATVLVQNGTLRSGDVIIAGTAVGHVRAMTDYKGNTVKAATPSVPVEIIGLSEVPTAGDEFNAVEDERMARELADQRRAKAKEAEFKSNTVTLDDLFAHISDGAKELNIIVKADVDGSAEAVKQSLEKISNDEVKVKVIHKAVGGITEGDVMFASASNAIIVGFNVRPDKSAIDSAERMKVDIRTYRIIYDCIEEITAAMKGMLAPTFKEVINGHAQVRQTIHVPSVGTIAGSYIQDGKVTRTSLIRVLRDGIVIFEDKISSLKRFKDDAREVAAGYECGIGLEKFNDIKENDILEAYEMVEVEK